MNVKKWFSSRGLKFVLQRGSILLSRYKISSAHAQARINDNLATLAGYSCSPTFFTPGIIVQRYPRFIQGLQSRGAEIAIHSYQHLDLNTLPLPKAIEQLTKAAQTYARHGIRSHGFRAPYLSWSDELLASLPAGLCEYSSNQSVFYNPNSHDHDYANDIIYNTLRRFYNPRSSTDTFTRPLTRSNIIEIPVCVPDDLQLHDGLALDSAGIAQVWVDMLQQTHHRGEHFNLIYHPELGSEVNRSFEALLSRVRSLMPKVWIAKLHEISDWWREKSKFDLRISSNTEYLKLDFVCSPRATILARGMTLACDPWDEKYQRLLQNELELPPLPRPFIGLAAGIPEDTVSFLREQGYIVETGESARDCSIVLDHATLEQLSTPRQLVDYIEARPGPLVRYWLWPDGARSAFTVTGDLDALTLVDYASRLLIS